METQEKFGQILVEKGIVDWDQFNEALQRQKTTMPDHKIGIILTRLGYITKEDIVDTLKVQNPDNREDLIRAAVYAQPTIEEEEVVLKQMIGRAAPTFEEIKQSRSVFLAQVKTPAEIEQAIQELIDRPPRIDFERTHLDPQGAAEKFYKDWENGGARKYYLEYIAQHQGKAPKELITEVFTPGDLLGSNHDCPKSDLSVKGHFVTYPPGVPTADILAPQQEPYEMPGPPYDILDRGKDPNFPKRGVVFPPSPKDKPANPASEQ